MSREQILASIKANQPALVPLPEIVPPASFSPREVIDRFTSSAIAIGSKVFEVEGFEDVRNILREQSLPGRVISSFFEFSDFASASIPDPDPHLLADVELAILKAELGVAENGALWLSEENMIRRALPFIAQHLAVIVEGRQIVANMHEAYSSSSCSNPGFGAFISGPSKTADIEQSLVLGAHGARSMTIFILNADLGSRLRRR